MLVNLSNIHKTLGARSLYKEVDLLLNPREKVGFIGRNGMGKSTLLRIISGLDREFDGDMEMRNGTKVVMTLQEHTNVKDVTPLDYILRDVPGYLENEKILQEYEAGHLTDLHAYSDAVELFSDRGYYYIKDLIIQSLKDFQLTEEIATMHLMGTLSGGQKRFVELVRVMYSQADLLLIDEPTNHMDYVGKEMFINWLSSAQESVLVVTHDRDVLKHVNKIIELKEQKLFSFKGNFSNYLQQNTFQTTNNVISYQTKLAQLRDAEKKVEWGNRMRAKSKAWKIKYDQFVREYETIKAGIEKPSFWIDQESVANIDSRVAESYEQFKEKNIRIAVKPQTTKVEELLHIDRVSLGYGSPLFSNMNFKMKSGDRIFLKGRNGAGKSTLVRTIMSMYKGETPTAKVFAGEIKLAPGVRIGEYEQEIDGMYLKESLGSGIRLAYAEHGRDITDQSIKQLLSQYLFDPTLDFGARIAELSGGQKARFQVIKMLSNQPNLLILDEPTNHLDLPSIEELENALNNYHGGILYISHDTYFVDNIGGDVVTL